jgi:hypothetical protein
MLRNRKNALKIVQELDAFPKVEESYTETTATGGGISLVVFLIIGILVVSEIRYYTATNLKFAYDIDPDFNGKLKLNLDITVAMKCNDVGADILDMTGQNAETFGHLQEEEVTFELSQNQRYHFEGIQRVNQYLRDEYHAIHEFLWNSGYNSMAREMPKSSTENRAKANACRFHGSLTVNKVAGNFHITAGKSVPVFPRGHAHLSMMLRESDYNFSHRIVQFSFGDPSPGIVNPLDGEEKITTENSHMFQYFIQVVPTIVDTTFSEMSTFQYSATEQNRTISHAAGSHGLPGIFVKYDLSSIRVHVREQHKPYWQFLVRLCGIIGGIYATSGILHRMIGLLVDLVCCRFKWTQPSRGDGPRHASSSSLGSGQSFNLLSTPSTLPSHGPVPAPAIVSNNHTNHQAR